MPNSGTVTAGSVALASQYNNLRSDVLNVSTGHTHTGASENGAQIEGTVIKSTGATVGAVLTAGTGGTATTWTVLSGGAGALGSAQVNLVFGTGTLTETTYNSTNTGGAWWAVGCGGTKIMSVDRVVNTSARTIQVYNLDTAAAAASTALALTIAGTVQRVIPSSTGFTAGTAFVVQETIDATTSGARTTTVRKLNQSLTCQPDKGE